MTTAVQIVNHGPKAIEVVSGSNPNSVVVLKVKEMQTFYVHDGSDLHIKEQSEVR